MSILAASETSAPSAVAVLCGGAEDVAAIANAAVGGVWRKMRLVGVIVPDAEGLKEIAGVPVLGAALTQEALSGLAGPADTAILCDPSQSRDIASAFLSQASDLRLRAMVATTKDRRTNLRKMRIADLLGGATSSIDWAHKRAVLAGKRILVTGAGGSIGSELCRKLINLWPARLTLLDSSELNLFNIDHELASKAPDLSRGRALCDIRDADAVARWFKRERPDIVLHVAALKQVPLVEEFPGEGVLTNVLGTRNVAEAAKAHGAHMMLVSTDKAVSPASVMGATKRTAEMLCQAMDRQAARDRGPRFLIARLGNVLGSAGSVSPLFERQIATGGPVTVTHEDVSRFFITIPQAAGFLLQALVAGLEKAAPRGVSLVLDMGAPMPVVELARDMIRLKGLRPDVDVAINFVGLRPGEKLIEQLIDEHETIESSPGAAIMAARSAPKDLTSLNIEIDRLVMMARAGHDEMVKTRLHALVSTERVAAAISF